MSGDMNGGGRNEAKRAFLEAAGWAAAALSPLAGDASNRRYERVADGPGGARAVLMDAPSERGEKIGEFLAFTGWLRGRGLSAPEIFSANVDGGFALIEDLGDDLYARVCGADAALEAPLYEAAVDLLVNLRGATPPVSVEGSGVHIDVRPYDEAELEREAMLALDWWLPGATGASPNEAMRAEYAALVRAASAEAAAARTVLTLRDYHAENLLWLPERAGDGRVGLLDYQDALAGHAAYDLVSLLEDARRDTSDALQAAMVERYLLRAGLRGEEAEAFRSAYCALGAVRNLKIVGIFARLWMRDGKPAYLDLIPRVWAHLERDLSHPALGDLAAFVFRHLPPPTDAALARVRTGRVAETA